MALQGNAQALSADCLAGMDGPGVQALFGWPRPVPLQDTRASLLREVTCCSPLAGALLDSPPEGYSLWELALITPWPRVIFFTLFLLLTPGPGLRPTELWIAQHLMARAWSWPQTLASLQCLPLQVGLALYAAGRAAHVSRLSRTWGMRSNHQKT